MLPKEKKVEILRAFRVSFNKIARERRRKPNASQISTVLVKIAACLEIGFPHVEKIISFNLPDAYGWNKTALHARIDNRGLEPQIRRRRPRGRILPRKPMPSFPSGSTKMRAAVALDASNTAVLMVFSSLEGA
jgi:hypothetical protein